MKGVYMFLAEGFEETEALAALDMLRRGKTGVKTVALEEGRYSEESDAAGPRAVTSSHGITVIADMTFPEFIRTAVPEASSEDFLIFPGGMPGSTNLASCEALTALMQEHYGNGGSLAAICAAPAVVLSRLDGIAGKNVCCYEGFEPALEKAGANVLYDGVVSDGRIVTARGAGLAVDFGLEILAHICGREASDAVRASIML